MGITLIFLLRLLSYGSRIKTDCLIKESIKFNLNFLFCETCQQSIYYNVVKFIY